MNDDNSRIRALLLDRYGLRIEPEMGQFLLERLTEPGDSGTSIPVMGGNARTGVAIRQLLAADQLRSQFIAAPSGQTQITTPATPA